jgi:hypothetical protein
MQNVKQQLTCDQRVRAAGLFPFKSQVNERLSVTVKQCWHQSDFSGCVGITASCSSAYCLCNGVTVPAFHDNTHENREVSGILASALPITKAQPVEHTQRSDTHQARSMGHKNSKLSEDRSAPKPSAAIRQSLWSKPSIATSLATAHGEFANDDHEDNSEDAHATGTSANIRPYLWSKPTIALSLATIYGSFAGDDDEADSVAEADHGHVISESKPSVTENMTEVRGNAHATITNKGREAVATAEGEHGSAHVWTNGKYVDYTITGNGRVVVGNGVAYASAGPDNAAVAVSLKAEKKASKHKSTRNQVVEAEDDNERRYEISR